MDIYALVLLFQQELQTEFIGDFLTLMPGYMAALAGAIMTINITIGVIKSFIGGSEQRINPSAFIRPILVLGALALYESLVELLMIDVVEIISESILYSGKNNTVSGGSSATMQTLMSASSINLNHTQTSGGADGGGIFDIIGINATLELIHLIIFFFSTIAVGAVLFKQLIVQTFYYLLGPIALALSLIPGNESVASKWFQGYLGVLLWTPLLMLVQIIIINLPLTNNGNELSPQDIIFSVAIQVLMIMAIFQVPKYADILVAQGSSGMAGNVGNRVQQLAGGAASKAYKMATKKG